MISLTSISASSTVAAVGLRRSDCQPTSDVVASSHYDMVGIILV
eukprot:CAMPEP_0198118334 /NCGR_PEP_ID=MMETSP1442-20131203/21225_1 /TAXON_ID= /ORGANISM="Craspedostauros australis, Strain CCMP3328" /LENGTH=43 /DNA_ID= /DNA_START= /DNA_END= /DNA_ORIENTATION=